MADTFTFNPAPPKEALDYFRAKGFKPSFDFRDVWREEHAAAFTVAKAGSLDVLTAIRGEVDRALAEGRTLAQFKRDLTPALQRLGWWGVKTMTDPKTGETLPVQLGSPRRLKIIYDTNLRTARAAGQWERIQRTKEFLPYLIYGLGPSLRHRPQHVVLDGTLLPADDPFWNTHFPPNGWRCKCWVRQVSEGEAGRRGWKVSPSPTVEYVNWTNKRTGQVERVPKGIDPGFDINPGKARRAIPQAALTQKLNTAAAAGLHQAAAQAVRQVVKSEVFGLWAEKPQGDMPVGILDEAQAGRIATNEQVVRISPDTLKKQRQNHPDIHLSEYSWVQETIERGEVIQDRPNSLIFVLEKDGYVSVVKAAKTGTDTFLTSFRRLSSDIAKRDRELQRLKQKTKK
ncbi:MAG: phage minor head protein [Deltaproteobacteria bacterium]|nr:phage minor head protein [Deltaproteobacteria bacterium]